MAAWLALAEERTYLAKLGRTLAHGARPEEAEAMAHEAALRFLNDAALAFVVPHQCWKHRKARGVC